MEDNSGGDSTANAGDREARLPRRLLHLKRDGERYGRKKKERWRKKMELTCGSHVWGILVYMMMENMTVTMISNEMNTDRRIVMTIILIDIFRNDMDPITPLFCFPNIRS